MLVFHTGIFAPELLLKKNMEKKKILSAVNMAMLYSFKNHIYCKWFLKGQRLFLSEGDSAGPLH